MARELILGDDDGRNGKFRVGGKAPVRLLLGFVKRFSASTSGHCQSSTPTQPASTKNLHRSRSLAGVSAITRPSPASTGDQASLRFPCPISSILLC